MDLEIAGRCALVTGASIGIGRGIAMALAQEGARLALVARREELLREVANAVIEIGAPEPLVIVQDMLAEDAIESMASQVEAQLGPVEILVNNAGNSAPFNLETDDAAWEHALTMSFTRQRQLTPGLTAGALYHRHRHSG